MISKPILTALAFAAAITATASGQTIGVEPFTYANGSIAGKTGGTGFNFNTFTNTVTATTSDWDTIFGSATNSIVGNQLVTNSSGFLREYNGPLEGAGTAADDTNNDHERSGAVRATGQVFYRFTLNRTAGAGWSGASSYEFGAEQLFFGVPGGASGTDTIGIEEFGANSGTTLGNINLTDGATYTMVAVIDFDNNKAGLFVNPGPEDYWNPRDGTNNADVVRVYTNNNWSSAVRLASSGQVTWDDLTVTRDAASAGLQTLGNETFTYADGAINGKTGGAGFNYNNFTDTVTATTSTWNGSNAADAAILGNQLVTKNSATARREYNGPTEGAGTAANDTDNNHERSGAVRATGQVFYRFTMNRASGNASWSGASSFAFANERIFFGVPSGGGGTDTAGIDVTGIGASYANVRLTDGTPYTMVAVIDYTNQSVGLFVNPGAQSFWDPSNGSNNADVTRPYTTFSTTTTADWSTAVRLASNTTTTWDDLTVSLNAAGVGLLTAIPDIDGDGLPAYWEVLYGLNDNDDGTIGENPPGAKNGPNGALGDPDGDGKTNAEEFAAGTNPQSNDSDGDGFTDTIEFAAGTNPANPASFPGADTQPGLIGVENFSYPNGSINGRKAGVHWDVDNSTLNDGFVGHTMTSSIWSASSGDPQIVGGILKTVNGSAARREYNGPGAADENSGGICQAAEQVNHAVYYRFQMTRRAGATWGGASSYDFGAERFLFGVPGAANPVSGQLEFAIHDLAQNKWGYSGIQPVVGQTYTLVGKLDFDTHTAALYLNPNLALAENGNTPVATYAFTANNWSTAVRFGSGGTGDVEWDKVRVANNWQALQEVPPVANNDTMTLPSGGKARILVTANDTGSINSYSVTLLTPPSNGTAVVDGGGGVTYQHTATGTTSDSFTYRVTSADGGSTATATVNVVINNALRFDTHYSNMPASPPATSLVVEDAFPNITFDSPHGFCGVPGDTKKIFVTEGDGRVFLIPDITAASPQKIQILDIISQVNHDNNELAMKSIAAHPNWASNGYIYVTYNTKTASVRLSRFTCQTTAPYTVVPGSEQVLIDQANAGTFHNIGKCVFGSDGYLYVAFGDEGGNQSDSYDNSQHIDKDIWSCIARLDVDKKPGSLIPNDDTDVPRVGGGSTGEANYRIPPNNPFVGATSFNGIAVNPANVRTEIFVCGLRNPWQFSTEDLDGNGTVDEVWIGDVGLNTREEVGAYTAGQNAGWAWREGTVNGVRSGQLINGAAQAAATLTAPLWDYGHGGGAFQGNCVVGGFLYRGTALPTLTGKYIFTDYISGNIWTLQRTLPQPTVERIGGEVAVVSLMDSPDGSAVLMLDRGNTGTNQGSGSIKRLKIGTTDTTFPQKLSQTNFFSDLTTLTPNPGGVAYTPNLRFWSDFAEKSRWFLVNNSADKVGYAANGPWSYPQGMVFVKHFDYPIQWETFSRTINGQPVTDRRPLPASPKVRLETRFLVRNAGGAYGVSYRWGSPQTDASLAESNGETFPVNITLDGQPTTIDWQIPSRTSCMTCHTPEAGHALSFNTLQLNRSGSIGGVTGNFISTLNLAGYLQGFSGDPAALPRHLRPDETAYSKEARVRSYLDVNCSYCHQAGGTGGGYWDGRSPLTLAQTGLINMPPLEAPAQPGDLLVTPGQPNHSVIYNRMALANGYSRMPPLATNEVDYEGAQLLAEWIAGEVSPHTTYASWRLDKFGSSGSSVGDPESDADGDSVSNLFEYLTHTNPNNPSDLWQPVFRRDGNNVAFDFTGLGDRRIQIYHSGNMQSWSPWQIPGNDGVPLNTGSARTLQGPMGAGNEFFRFKIEER